MRNNEVLKNMKTEQRVQWRVDEGWMVKQASKLATGRLVATYFQGKVATAFQYLVPDRIPGVKVLR
jgi:hypothetical protein